MSKDPFPNGRWTPARPPKAGGPDGPPSPSPVAIESSSAASKKPLRDLFLTIPESRLLEEARQRVEGALAAVIARRLAIEAQQEFAWS